MATATERSAKYREANREKVRTYAREYARKHSEKHKAKNLKWYYENKEHALAKKAEWRAANRDRVLAQQAEYRAANRARINESAREWAARNSAQVIAITNRRRASKLKATPKWTDVKATKRIYKTAALITSLTGVKHNVDHIVPLRSEAVCGLHVPANLRVITAQANRSKSNRYWPAMQEAANG